MSKKKGLPLHVWQKLARIESVRADLSALGDDARADFERECLQQIYLNKPAREALQPYLDDSGKTPDAS